MVVPVRYTSQKQQERISRRQLCERLDEFGWIATPPDEDLGEDFIVHIYLQGRATGVTFHVQEKSVTNLNERRKGDFLVYDFEVKDLKHWEAFSLPVVLMVWDIKLREGRWALVDNVISDLDQRRPRWRENKSTASVHIPWGNTTDDAGLVKLKQSIGWRFYPNIAKDRQPKIKELKLHFPDTIEGKATQASFERFLKEGEQVTIKRKFLKKFELSEWWMRWFGRDNLIDISLESRPSSESFPVIMDMVSVNGKMASLSSVELKVIKSGTEVIQLSNKHQDLPLHFHLTIPKSSDKESTLSIKVSSIGRHVREAHDTMKFLEAVTAGGTLKLTFLTWNDEWLDFPVPSNPKLVQLVDKLYKIRDRVGQLIPISKTLTGKDVEAINTLSEIIEYGKTITKVQEKTIDLTEVAKDVILDIHHQAKPIRMRQAFDESSVNLFGLEIPTGPGIQYIGGTPVTPVVELARAISELAPNEPLSIKLIDVEIVNIFPDWFIREAQRLSQLLAEKFEIEAIYLFGSLVWSEVHTPETDIDLAVSGLPEERFLEAVSYLERESKFLIDLVDLSKVSDHLRQRILTEGKLLYEREPVAAFG